MLHLVHGGCVRRSGKEDSGKYFASSFLHKYKNPLTHYRSSTYDDNQDGRTGTPEFSEISKGEVPKLSAGKRITDSVRDGGKSILQLRPHTDD